MIGQTISQYRILEKLGEGGMGVVYKAHDTKLDRTVALKFLPHHLTASEAERSRLLQEARAAAALNHPHVCSVIDIQDADGQQFIVMEYVDGVTLARKIPVPRVDDALTYAIDIGEALQEAHGQGIVHRDIKSENIMVNSKGQIKVMDFGLARLRGSLKLTRTSSTVGTLAYMAPEQIQGGEADARSDIFSFGIVLFEMLTGRLPFRGEHEAAVMYSIVNELPEAVVTLRPDVPPDLGRIVGRMLEKEPADRYQHVDDIVSELRMLRKTPVRVVAPEHVEQPGTHRAAVAPGKSGVRLWIAAAAIVLLAGAAWILVLNSPAQKITSIAVLPFVNAGSDQSAEYLSDGVTESLINSLSRIPGIKMMSRSSVFRYKGKDVDPRVAGKELNVGALMLGRIAQRGDALSVSVELVNTSDNSHIWGEQYERQLSGIISLENEISHSVSQQLSSTITREQGKEITRNATENTEAYQLYLKGRFYWNKRTAEGFAKAVDMFQQAIDKDPGYALACSGLADCYVLMSSYYLLPPSEGYAKARASATKAIDLDNTLAAPHAVLASIFLESDWDFVAAEREFRRSLELDPNYATALHWYGEFLAAMGRKEEGLAELQRAIESDPLAPVLYQSSSWIHCSMGDYEKSLTDAKRALELDRGFPRAMMSEMESHIELGRSAEALTDARDALAASNNGIEYRSWLGYAYGRSGNRKEAERILADLLESSRKEFVAPVLIAVIYAGLGEKDKAFQWLEKVYNDHAGDVIYLNLEPAWKLLRGDPRFAALTKKIGLPQ